MRLMIDRSQGKQHYLYYYEQFQTKWLLKRVYSINVHDELLKRLKLNKECIDYIITSLNTVYRESYYCYYPEAMLVVSPYSMWYVLEKMWHIQGNTWFKVAASSEYELRETENYESVATFLRTFYKFQAKEQAIAYYEYWQLTNPYCDVKVWQYIHFIELFKKEIFNFFEWRQIMISKQKKRR